MNKTICMLLSLAFLAPVLAQAQSADYEPEEEGFVTKPRKPQPDDRFCVSKDDQGNWVVSRVLMRSVGASCEGGKGTVQRRDQIDTSDPALRRALAKAGS